MARFPEIPQPPPLGQVRAMLMEAAVPVADTLEALGYRVEGWDVGTGEFGPSAYLIYANPEAKRKARLSLAWVDGSPFVGLSLVRIPREGIQDYLDLGLFAQKANPGFDQQVLAIAPEKPVRNEAGRVFRAYAEILQGPAAPILRGEAWEEGHYVDWTL